MRNHTSKKAFTIVELLTVMGVIAILIGLLVPALQVVRRIAKDTKQRAQFHSISVALDIVHNDEGDYPDSSAIGASGTITTGAQRLAEALVGRDLQGFDPMTTWDAQADEASLIIYASDLKSSSTTQIQESMQRRKGPYLKLENVGAFNVDDLYTTVSTNIYGSTINKKQAPTITDVFTDRSVTLTNGKVVKAGTPILYFKANTANKNLQNKTPSRNWASATVGYDNVTYNYRDNQDVVELGRMMRQTDLHPVADSAGQHQKFYDVIMNPQIATNSEGVAYNADTFILMSAGKDGLFGTADDVYNFGD